MQVQDKQYISETRYIPRIPLILLDQDRNYVGHIYVFESPEDRTTCEMRGIRIGMSRLISQAVEGKPMDRNIAKIIIASGVLPTCKRMGYSSLRVKPVQGSRITQLMKDWKWNKYHAKLLSELESLLVEKTAPDVSSSFY